MKREIRDQIKEACKAAAQNYCDEYNKLAREDKIPTAHGTGRVEPGNPIADLVNELQSNDQESS